MTSLIRFLLNTVTVDSAHVHVPLIVLNASYHFRPYMISKYLYANEYIFNIILNHI